MLSNTQQAVLCLQTDLALSLSTYGARRRRKVPAISSRAWRNNKTFSEAEVEKQFFETIRPTSLLKRFESTEEVASVVAFVASTQAMAINGAAVRAEGVIRSIF
jgi:NAD(P)-dependent dehydrogenase (short-subunit alcohol dehydrogenase family)